ncbi:MAG: ABC transporter ATP-binding protein [Solirubrobacteraceae bacterium]
MSGDQPYEAGAVAPGMTAPRPESTTPLPGAQSALLEVAHLRVTYRGVPAVSGVSLGVRRGEIVGLIGPNGAGKSSALNAISGDVRPAGGAVRLAGKDLTRLAPYRRARLGLARTSQTARVFEGLTVFEGLATIARGAQGASLTRTLIHRGQRDEERQASARVWELLDHHGFAHIADLYGRELSGGQRRFVDLAMALIRSPQMLLLDEPMVGVAPAILPRLMEALQDVARQGIGILMVEHALDVVAALCDRVIVMAAGEVIAEGTYQEIAADVEVRRAYLS